MDGLYRTSGLDAINVKKSDSQRLSCSELGVSEGIVNTLRGRGAPTRRGTLTDGQPAESPADAVGLSLNAAVACFYCGR